MRAEPGDAPPPVRHHSAGVGSRPHCDLRAAAPLRRWHSADGTRAASCATAAAASHGAPDHHPAPTRPSPDSDSATADGGRRWYLGARSPRPERSVHANRADSSLDRGGARCRVRECPSALRVAARLGGVSTPSGPATHRWPRASRARHRAAAAATRPRGQGPTKVCPVYTGAYRWSRRRAAYRDERAPRRRCGDAQSRHTPAAEPANLP
mmetsp:Transcript_34360/g.86243  ORF Transcript_34360/g.86243 Transcript_34360/m.86243 type:complete len:210 (-) Transcript_34360:288-917(-)